MYNFYKDIACSDRLIIAQKTKTVNKPTNYKLQQIKRPGIPNKALALSIYYSGSPVSAQQIQEDVKQYNDYVSFLNEVPGFITAFTENGLTISKNQALTIWPEEVVKKIFSLNQYYFETPLHVEQDILYDCNFIQAYNVTIADLYLHLTHPDYGYGLRKGVIPIYLAAVLHEFKREIVITDSHGQVNLNADTLAQINAKPEDFSLAYLNWTPEKEKFVQDLTNLFSKQVNEAEKAINSYDYVVQAMKRWYFDLPKYTKEARKTVSGDKIERGYLQFIKLLKQDESSHG